MKILIYNAFEDEVEEALRWSKERQVEVAFCPHPLSPSTIHEACGYDGISIRQGQSIGGEQIYRQLKQFNIQQISVRSVGYDTVDLVLAKANGLMITNVPAYSPYAVAELAVAQALQLTRQLSLFQARFAKHDFHWHGLVARELRRLTVGIVGTGHIGSVAARLFKSLGATVIGYDVVPNDELNGVLTYQQDFKTLLSRADIVSLHVPLLSSTHHLINEETLNLMKRDAILINAARGGLVDTAALIQALESRSIAGAALDVYEDEWFINQDLSGKPFSEPWLTKLMIMDHVLLTPHVGFYTTTAVHNIVYTGLDNVIDVIQTGKCANDVS
ncbi:MAG: D-2-hydroxyacid dehydrogenase [Sporolactobacillus sp.]